MAQDALKLSLGGDGKHRGHEGVQIRGRRHPFARLALREAAIEDELDLEPTERGGGFEHLALDTAGAVPGRPPAGGGLERKDQPPPPPPPGPARRPPPPLHKLFPPHRPPPPPRP